MASPPNDLRAGMRGQRWLVWLGGGAGLVLVVIGIRFLVVPEAATRMFGLGPKPATAALDAVIGLRDLWLGTLAVALALLREWRALALWLLLGAGVCLGDAAIVAYYGGPAAALAFHVVSGLLCAGVGWLCWRQTGRK
jgi:hypothetical protein